MPTATKPKDGWPGGWFCEPFELSPERIEALATYAGNVESARRDALRAAVADALGQYKGMRESYANAPRAAHQAAAFERLHELSRDLVSAIRNLDANSSLLLRTSQCGLFSLIAQLPVGAGARTRRADGFEILPLLEMLERLEGHSFALNHVLEQVESRGAPKDAAVALVLTLLVNVFNDYARADGVPAPDLIGFIREACAAAKIALPESDDKLRSKLPR